MTFRNLPTRQKLFVAFLAPMLLMVSLGVFVIQSLTNIEDTAHQLDEMNDILVESGEVFRSVLNLETGMRGYLLAGRDEFLDPYRDGEKATQRLLTALKEKMAGQEAQVARLTQIENLVRQWQTAVATPTIELRREIILGNKTMEDMAANVARAKGKAYFDQIRLIFAEFEEAATQLSDEKKQASIITTRQTYQWTVILIVVTIFAGLILSYMTGLNIARPLSKATAAFEEQASKGFSQLIDDTGRQDEVGKLIRAFNALSARRSQTEAELMYARLTAEDSNRSKSDFLANMSHEIRTPLNGVIGTTGLLLETALSNKQRQFAETTMTSAQALLTLVNDILDLSKIEAEKMELEQLAFDLQELIENIVELMAVKCKEKGIELLLRYKIKDQHLTIGDPGRLRQILLNLLANAIKFTEEGYVVLTVNQTKSTAEGQLYRFDVQDTGIGIPKKSQHHIFNAFDQADSSTTRKYGGTGLGLSICKKLVHMMDGDIGLRSKVDEGSTFWFTSKLKQGEEKKPSTIKTNPGVLKGTRILIVDSNKVARLIAGEQLRGLDTEVDYAATGEEALLKLCQAATSGQHYDTIVTDRIITGMDGLDLIKKIRSSDQLSALSIVLMTSAPNIGDSGQMRRLGVAGYLSKPILPGEVPAVLATVLQNTRAGQSSTMLVTRHSLRGTSEKAEKTPTFADVKVLLAEDNAVNLMIAQNMLRQLGCQVTPAGNGLEALELLKTNSYDLVFMDCQMPEMDGYEATRERRAHEAESNSGTVPIVALTANAMAGDKKRCLQAGMSDYVTKPVERSDLEQILAKWVPHKKVAAQPEGIDKAPSVDMDAIDQLGDIVGPKTLLSLIESYLNFSEGALPSLMKAAHKKDREAMKRHAHNYKGCCDQVGATILAELARDMELYILDDKLDEAIAVAVEFEKASLKIDAELNNFLDEKRRQLESA